MYFCNNGCIASCKNISGNQLDGIKFFEYSEAVKTNNYINLFHSLKIGNPQIIEILNKYGIYDLPQEIYMKSYTLTNEQRIDLQLFLDKCIIYIKNKYNNFFL